MPPPPPPAPSTSSSAPPPASSSSSTHRVSTRTLALGAAAAVAVPAAAAAAWWLAEVTFNSVTPHQYHYRPGTISSFISRALDRHARRRRAGAPVRVYMDGCFDVMHYGHANALRQAKALGDELVVGLIPDSEIRRYKGPPVMNDDERRTMVESLKWVDEVITDVPYDLTPAFLEELFTRHRIDVVVHGDDPCLLPDGTDAYAGAKAAGRFRMIKRTEGVSTTDIVGRALLRSRGDGWGRPRPDAAVLTKQFSARATGDGGGGGASLPGTTPPVGDGGPPAPGTPKAPPPAGAPTTVSRFLPTTRRIVQFSDGGAQPGPDDRVVYIDGAFDLFHPGHVAALRAARERGDFLLVGVHTDADVAARRGPGSPIMDLHERALSVLACRYANEVVIGAPAVITDDLIKTFNIAAVLRGTTVEGGDAPPSTSTRPLTAGEADRYAVPRARGIFETFSSPSPLTAASLVDRIVANRTAYEARNAAKTASERAYYGQKTYVGET